MATPTTRYIETLRTARIEFLGDPKAASELWIVLHGYAETATDFIAQFEGLAGDKRCIIAPEGLSRFYRRGMRGDVAASWMTSRDRETEIHDYLRYLDAVYEEVAATDEVKLGVLGFSQGAATAARWATSGSIPNVDHLVLWGGAWPEDTVVNAEGTSIEALTFVLGEDDPYVSIETVKHSAANVELPYDVVRYEGAHSIDVEVLANVIASH